MTRKIFILVIISLLVVFLLVYMLTERRPFGAGNTSFAVRAKDEITRIGFSDESNRLSLVKEGEGWFVNGRHETRKTSISFIIKVLTGMEIKSPVAQEVFKKEITDKGVTPVRVKVYDHWKVIGSFLVYKTSSNKYGNILKIKETSKPFIVYVPGSEIEIGSAFTLQELFWQPYTVFNLLPSEISSVKFDNIRNPDSSFTIRSEMKQFYLSYRDNDLSGWDTSQVTRYLSYFTHVPFESWALDLSDDEKVKISGSVPVYTITVKKADGNNIVLKLWERYTGDDPQRKPDSDRLWGMIEGSKELFIIRFMDIDPILKKRSYFFKG